MFFDVIGLLLSKIFFFTGAVQGKGSLIPDYYPRHVPRLVSCYALFK